MYKDDTADYFQVTLLKILCSHNKTCIYSLHVFRWTNKK